MKSRLSLHILIVLAVVVQVVVRKYIHWFPDVILILVVFAGVFRGASEGLLVGLITGFLRGCFSPYTFSVDLFLFPLVGVISAMLAIILYRQNLAVQVFVVLVAAFTVISGHVFYLNVVSGNNVAMPAVLFRSRPVILATAITAPLIFNVLRRLWYVEE